MPQARNSGRRAELGEKKRRAAGRQNSNSPERRAIRDANGERPARGKTGGAFGKHNRANPRGGQDAVLSSGAGGATVPSQRAPVSVSRSSRGTRKRGT
jgi:hypothetical protein